MSCLCIFIQKFEETAFEISTIDFYQTQKFEQKWEIVKLDPKIPFWGYFKMYFLKDCHIRNQYTRGC